jgi:hypothetical protein
MFDRSIVKSIGKIQPLFTRAHPPATPRTSSMSPLGALPSRTRTPAAGESSVDYQAGRAARRGQGEKTGANVWACLLQGADWRKRLGGCNPLAHAEAL